MGRPRHAATPVRRRPGIRLDRLPRTAVPAAAVVALAAALALVVPALARAGQPAPVALSAVPLSVPADPAGGWARDPAVRPSRGLRRVGAVPMHGGRPLRLDRLRLVTNRCA